MGSNLLSPFCHPGSNFGGKKIKNPSIVDDVFFSIELELGTYINLYLFESSIDLNDLLGIVFLSDSTKISDYAERAEPAALQNSLHKS